MSCHVVELTLEAVGCGPVVLIEPSWPLRLDEIEPRLEGGPLAAGPLAADPPDPWVGRPQAVTRGPGQGGRPSGSSPGRVRRGVPGATRRGLAEVPLAPAEEPGSRRRTRVPSGGGKLSEAGCTGA